MIKTLATSRSSMGRSAVRELWVDRFTMWSFQHYGQPTSDKVLRPLAVAAEQWRWSGR
ncbi:MAG TPA: hypothetical protein VM537_09065 [Anaerolineae bacterium]|nr:hypothetical protein [Anaerolineae bacterium]